MASTNHMNNGQHYWISFPVVAALAFLIFAQPAFGAGVGSLLLREAVTVPGIRGHQAALQAVADANGGTRAAGEAGYNASADYIASQLTSAGYDVDVLEFDFPFFEDVGPSDFQQVSPVAVSYVDQTDYDVMGFSGSGATGVVDFVGIDLSLVLPRINTSGCEATDFDPPAPSVAGKIAVLQRGACSFALKATNAEAAGAVGVVFFNQGDNAGREGLFLGTLGAPVVSIPVVSTSFALGEELSSGATGSLETNTISEMRTTSNVIAQTKTGDPNNVVFLGAHLDSVRAGPGIQDNGSGSATILEIALQLASEFGVNDAGYQIYNLNNAVRFGWWGAKELGLLGSFDYVSSLTTTEFDQIAVYLNFDMIGSPNFVRFVYDGDGSDFPPAIPLPPESAAVEQVFLDYFSSQGLATEATQIDGRSDYLAFCASGIPCGGLFTGAEGIKTPGEAAVYGGTAGDQYDPCYHLACDTYDNISLEALDQMSDAAADATAVLAELSMESKSNSVPALNAWQLGLLGLLILAVVRLSSGIPISRKVG